MRQGLVKCDALLRALDEQAGDQVLAILGVVGPLRRVEDDPILTGHPYRLLLRVVVKWQRAAQKGVNYAAQRPQVARECVRLLLKDLRGDIAKSAEGFRGFLIGSNHFG